jgi:hypothetical protein
MRIVFVVPELPHPPFTGAHTRPLSMIKALALSHSVVAVGAAPPDADLALMHELCAHVLSGTHQTAARSPAHAALSTLRRSLSPVPFISQSQSAVLQELVSEAVQRHQPAAVQLEGMYTSHYRDPAVPTVLDLPDVVSSLCAAAFAARPIRYAFAGAQQYAAQRAERRLLREFAAVIAINELDRGRLAGLGIDAVTVPLATTAPSDSELTQAAPPTVSPERPLNLLFVGSFLHQPNRVASMWLERRLAPELRRRGLPFRLTIAGRQARPYGGRRYPDVVFCADAPDLAPLYAAADVVLVPLEHGGGTKNKTLEAMAWARPVVGTAQAFTGLAAAPDNAFALCPLDATAMAATLEALARDPQRRAEMGAAARRHVLEYHGQERVNELMQHIYAQIAR